MHLTDTTTENAKAEAHRLDELLRLGTRGGDERARQLAKAVLARDSSNRPALRAMAILALRAHDYVDAERRFETLLESGPPDAELLCWLGLSLERQQRVSLAIERYVEALRVNPRYSRAAENLSRLGVRPASTIAERPPTPAAVTSSSGHGRQPPASLATLLGSNPGDLDRTTILAGRRRPIRRRLLSFTTHLLAAFVFGVVGVGNILAGSVARPAGVLSLGIAASLLGYAVLGSYTYRYTRYDYRIVIERGVFFRRQQVIWLFRILDVDYVQTPLLSLTGTARLDIAADHLPLGRRASPQRGFRLVGIGSDQEMQELADDLRLHGLLQRRDLLGNFV